MEYHSSDDKAVAGRVFEKGLEIFGDEIDYVQRYLGFLISINDTNSQYNYLRLLILALTRYPFPDARALFERVIPNFPPEHARPLWERWARYEYQYGDLEAALKLEKRMAEVYPGGAFVRHLHLSCPTNIRSKDPPIKRLAQRHIYLGTDAIADRDLGFAVARRSGGNSVGRTETTQS